MLSRNSRDIGWSGSRSKSELSNGASTSVIDSQVFLNGQSLWLTVEKLTTPNDEENYIHVDAGTPGQITITPEGTQADIDLYINPKGNGIVYVNGEVMNAPLEIDLSGDAVATPAYGTIGTVTLSGLYEMLVVEIDNDGTGDLTDFKIQRQTHASGSFADWLSGSDFTSVSETLEETGIANGNYANTLADDDQVQIKLDVMACYAVKFLAQGVTPTINIRGYAV
jgi:hypothetical protein